MLRFFFFAFAVKRIYYFGYEQAFKFLYRHVFVKVIILSFEIAQTMKETSEGNEPF